MYLFKTPLDHCTIYAYTGTVVPVRMTHMLHSNVLYNICSFIHIVRNTLAHTRYTSYVDNRFTHPIHDIISAHRLIFHLCKETHYLDICHTVLYAYTVLYLYCTSMYSQVHVQIEMQNIATQSLNEGPFLHHAPRDICHQKEASFSSLSLFRWISPQCKKNPSFFPLATVLYSRPFFVGLAKLLWQKKEEEEEQKGLSLSFLSFVSQLFPSLPSARAACRLVVSINDKGSKKEATIEEGGVSE